MSQSVQSLHPSAKVIACWLALHPRAHVTGGEIAEGTGFANPRTIREHVRALVAGGWLAVEGDHGSPLGCHYVLCRDARPIATGPPNLGAAAPTHPGAAAPPRSSGSGVAAPLPLALSLSSQSGTSSLQVSGSLADTHASDARAQGGETIGECGIIEVALDAALRSLPGITARYVGARAGDGHHARVVLDAIDAVRGEASRKTTAEAWAHHFVREFRHRTMRNFALYAESRAANGGRKVVQLEDATPIAGTDARDPAFKASAELHAKMDVARAEAVPAPANVVDMLSRIGRPVT